MTAICSRGWANRCPSSKGPRCKCGCGGRNHGTGNRGESAISGEPRYQIVTDVPGEPLVIRDLGPWDRHPTVTNAAEAVVSELVALGYLPSGRALHYYDSEGRLDQLLVCDGAFAGFAPVGATA